MGPTGVAATNYDGGMTTHSLIGISQFTKYPITQITDKMKQATKKLGKAMWMVMDEVSMYAPTIFVATHKIFSAVLQNDGGERPFGGLSIILGGDFYQKTTPAGMALSEALFKYGMKDKMKDTNTKAAKQFSRFRKFELTKVYRQNKGEEKLTQMLDTLRHDEQPMEKVLSMLRGSILTKKDLKDPKWRFAPTIVSGNRERLFINDATVRRYAKTYGQPLLMWHVRLKRGYDELTGEPPRQLFVTDAPAILSKNSSTSLVRLRVIQSGAIAHYSVKHSFVIRST